MKCEIVQDLLPSYIEKLTSVHSNEEIEKHLQSCESCLQFYNEMTATANLSVPIIDKEEVNKLNYFKKVKKEYKNSHFFRLIGTHTGYSPYWTFCYRFPCIL